MSVNAKVALHMHINVNIKINIAYYDTSIFQAHSFKWLPEINHVSMCVLDRLGEQKSVSIFFDRFCGCPA